MFSHNDLLPANFIQDQEQIWLIDWEYAGFNTPLFDLGGLASNNDFNENEEKYLVNANQSLAFLQDALEARNWNVSFQDISTSTFEGNYDQAVRAVGLFNAYCARCHTAGYSAGVSYTQKIASGGLGPALRAGRANVQFKEREDMIQFIVNGSYVGKAYGVNGVGQGRMPGFGAVLPESDIGLIIDLLRGMIPDA